MKRKRTFKAVRRQSGFSLIEMVAAFLVFAIGIGVLMQVLDPQAVEPPPQQYAAAPGQTTNGPVTAGAGNPGALQVAPFDLYQIDLTVFWGGRFGSQRHSARFSTLRTVNPDPNNMMQGQLGQPVQSRVGR